MPEPPPYFSCCLWRWCQCWSCSSFSCNAPDTHILVAVATFPQIYIFFMDAKPPPPPASSSSSSSSSCSAACHLRISEAVTVAQRTSALSRGLTGNTTQQASVESTQRSSTVLWSVSSIESSDGRRQVSWPGTAPRRTCCVPSSQT